MGRVKLTIDRDLFEARFGTADLRQRFAGRDLSSGRAEEPVELVPEIDISQVEIEGVAEDLPEFDLGELEIEAIEDDEDPSA